MEEVGFVHCVWCCTLVINLLNFEDCLLCFKHNQRRWECMVCYEMVGEEWVDLRMRKKRCI